MLIYGELAARWYRLLDPLEDHFDEAACYEEALLRGAPEGALTLLELGSGAGNNASYLKRRFACTLADRSSDMLEISRATNPECEHVQGDMRALRLGRTFDAIFVHDAVMYITTEEDLRAVGETAFVHTRPGGAALFAPDYVKETFREGTQLIAGEQDGRALRCIEWVWDPSPDDTTFITDYVFALREEGRTSVHHDQHVGGLFARDTWLRIMSGAGYRPDVVECVLDGIVCETFLCRRP